MGKRALRRTDRKEGELGQATFEWVGLVLLATLALGGLAALRPSFHSEAGLGRAVASRIACAAAGTCMPRPGASPAEAAPAAAAPAPAPRRTRVKRVDAFRTLRGRAVRGLGQVGKRLWIVCLGYRRFVYELEHPRAPTEAMPLEEALDIADNCFNPLNFLGED